MEENVETRGRPRSKKHEDLSELLLGTLATNGLFRQRMTIGSVPVTSSKSLCKRLAAYRAFRESASFKGLQAYLKEQGFTSSAFHRNGVITVRAEKSA